MRTTLPTLGTIAPLALGTAACGGRPADERPADATAALDEAAAASNLLDPEVLRGLEAKLPVLRQAPAPPPHPDPDADPRNVPQRVRDALGDDVLQTATGGATFYADHFEGRRTASGIPFHQNQMVAAHRSFPFGTILRVTNLGNDRSVNVRVVDRGPFGSGENARRTIIDLSRRAAAQLDFVGGGRAQVRVEVLQWGEGLPASG